ncbi:hypothetical protein COF68_04965 [Bacillus toyonensis]|uniref:hypothetical protein n=1 Tax=Bacillus toyonensis TaxID=155322 RepID=UPI000BFCC9C4|nr:hypothetical protein [Bacillus toyonensis]PHE64199.1 hypothetical protein COF68_04965 [Bacillus toyonensis]
MLNLDSVRHAENYHLGSQGKIVEVYGRGTFDLHGVQLTPEESEQLKTILYADIRLMEVSESYSEYQIFYTIPPRLGLNYIDFWNDIRRRKFTNNKQLREHLLSVANLQYNYSQVVSVGNRGMQVQLKLDKNHNTRNLNQAEIEELHIILKAENILLDVYAETRNFTFVSNLKSAPLRAGMDYISVWKRILEQKLNTMDTIKFLVSLRQ